jgi:hypothetical protein
MGMSYNLTLHCGCTVYVSCHPKTRVAHTRIIQSRGAHCSVRKHALGTRLFLWEMLPDRVPQATADRSDQRPVFGEEITDRG